MILLHDNFTFWFHLLTSFFIIFIKLNLEIKRVNMLSDQCLYYEPDQIIRSFNSTKTTTIFPSERAPYLSRR